MLPKSLKLRRIQISDDLSQETTAFTAELELYGKTIGSVRNEGTGGSHGIVIFDRFDRGCFERFVAEWAQNEHVTLEPADRLINALLDRHQIHRAAIDFAHQQRVAKVVCIRKTPVRLDSEPEAPPLGWEENYLLALPDGTTAQELARRESADTYLSFTFGQSWLPPTG